MFRTLHKRAPPFEPRFNLSSADAIDMDEPSFCRLIKDDLFNEGKILDFQSESNCRQQYKYDPKFEIRSERGRKYCGKRRKCWLPAFSSFSTIFF